MAKIVVWIGASRRTTGMVQTANADATDATNRAVAPARSSFPPRANAMTVQLNATVQ